MGYENKNKNWSTTKRELILFNWLKVNMLSVRISTNLETLFSVAKNVVEHFKCYPQQHSGTDQCLSTTLKFNQINKILLISLCLDKTPGNEGLLHLDNAQTKVYLLHVESVD